MFARSNQERPTTNRGFTLIEMVVVVSWILILISIVVPVYNRVTRRTREAVLRPDLFTMRQVILQYTLERRKARALSRTCTGTPSATDSLRSADQSNRLVGGGGTHIRYRRNRNLQRAQQFQGISSDVTAYATWLDRKTHRAFFIPPAQARRPTCVPGFARSHRATSS